MRCFTYSDAEDIGSAISEVNTKSEVKFVAGGTNLIDLMKENVERPGHLVGIKKLPFAQVSSNESGGLRLGAMVTNADTAYNNLVQSKYPLLSKAILAGASAQLRNMATNGGNLMQRTRCYYFYDVATPCNKREPGTGCSAINGYNRIHAILGASENCIAVYPSDMSVALAALEAVVNVQGPSGERNINFTDFHRLPGDTPEIDNNLQKGEVITGIDLPANKFASNYNYLKLRDRNSYAFALVSVAAALELDGNTIKDVKVALGGVAHKPWKNKEIESSFAGREASKETFKIIASELIAGAKGYEHNSFKITLAQRAIVRALEDATKMTAK